ncbi:hypothetical protein GJ496_006910 [Pomphorhynchus laevis]|nr:hypothetical protein GJ496_006910 [Pomphorhynchus laevis]
MGSMLSKYKVSRKLDSEEIRWLGKRFIKLDTDKSGTLSLREFLAIPSLRRNPLARRIVQIFDVDNSGEIDFAEFLTGISTFSTKGGPQKKLKFAFKVFDSDKDGYITNCELFDVTKAMVGRNLNDIQLQQLVDKTIMYNDLDGDGKISYDEFCRALGPILLEDVERNMNILDN